MDVELIIFVAIMLHKAPAAFGFTTFLIHEVSKTTHNYYIDTCSSHSTTHMAFYIFYTNTHTGSCSFNYISVHVYNCMYILCLCMCVIMQVYSECMCGVVCVCVCVCV